MTKTRKNGLLLTLAAFSLATISAALLFMIAPHRPAKADEEEQAPYTLTYTLNDDEQSYTVSGYTGTPVNVEISSTYNDLPVTKIASQLFRSCIDLISINIPDSVTEIGSGAFYLCDGLRTVTMSNNITVIGNSAFSECHSLTSVTIPNNLTHLNKSIFYGCLRLTNITIPNGVEDIGDYAFYNCEGLESVTIPNTVTSIGKMAFWNCSGLTELTIPTNAIIILDDHCLPSTLTTLYVPARDVDVYKNRYSAYASIITAIPDNTGEPQTNEPTEPGEPEDPSIGENPGDTPANEQPTETNNQNSFNFGEWLHNAGEDVSAWLGDNVGIATTGSTVLIVGAIIIAILLFRKRR